MAIVWPLIILGGMIMFNGGAPFTETTLYALVLVGAVAAGVLASLSVAGSSANWGKQTFMLIAFGVLYAFMSALNVVTLISFAPFVYLYAAMSVSFILGLIVLVGQS